MKKKILITILIVIIIAIGLIALSVFLDIQQETKLKTELLEISDLSNAENIDIEAINQRLERTVTTGDYAIVEQSFKEYLKDNFNNSIKIAEILNDEKLTHLLTAENYLEDGKDFIETKNYITTTKQTLEECKTTYTEFFTEEKAMSYINGKQLDDYYINLYKQELVGDIEEPSSDYTTVQNSIDEIIQILNISEEVINFLSENQDSWQIINEKIVFHNTILSNEYDTLVNQLSK